VERFELPTLCSQSICATRLRYTRLKLGAGSETRTHEGFTRRLTKPLQLPLCDSSVNNLKLVAGNRSWTWCLWLMRPTWKPFHPPAINLVETKGVEPLWIACKATVIPLYEVPVLLYILVREEGFEPPMFTLWEQIYSLLQNHRLCRSRILLAPPRGIEPLTLGRQPSRLPLQHGGKSW
jgi:hypothetical protein